MLHNAEVQFQGTHHHTHKLLPSLFISFHIKPFTCPAGGPLGAVSNHRGLRILSVCKIVASEVLVETICSRLGLVMEFMNSAKSFSINNLSLASESSYVDTESDYNIWC